MTRFRLVPEPSIIVPLTTSTGSSARQPLTFTGAIGAACMLPLRGIINLCVALRVHPNTLTLIGVLINVGAEIVADAVPERTRLADVDGVAILIEVQIHAGLLGQPADLFLEFVDGHTII